MGSHLFLKLIKIDKNDGSSEFLKYEKLLDSDEECDMKCLRKLKGGIKRVKVEGRKYLAGVGRRDNVSNRKNLGKKRINTVVLGRDNVDNLKTYPRKARRKSVFTRGDNAENSKLVSAKEKRNVMVQRNDIVEKSNRFRVKKRRKVVQRRDNVDDPTMEPQNKCEQKFGKYDSCYRLFIRSAEVKGDSLSVDNGKRLTYEEEDNERSSDLEILDMDNVLNHKDRNFSPFVVTKVFATSVVEDDSLSMGNPSKKENPLFRKTLMGILRRPYNQEEYENLLQKVKRRHLKGDPEDSRGVKKTIPSDTYGKSPLDYHTGLRSFVCTEETSFFFTDFLQPAENLCIHTFRYEAIASIYSSAASRAVKPSLLTRFRLTLLSHVREVTTFGCQFIAARCKGTLLLFHDCLSRLHAKVSTSSSDMQGCIAFMVSLAKQAPKMVNNKPREILISKTSCHMKECIL